MNGIIGLAATGLFNDGFNFAEVGADVSVAHGSKEIMHDAIVYAGHFSRGFLVLIFDGFAKISAPIWNDEQVVIGDGVEPCQNFFSNG